MKRFSLTAVFISLISLGAFAFSEKDIISPAAGTWCNQQALVLNSFNATEIYYSLTGSDPFVSGFAYDGPVLIERKGSVCVRIGVVESDGVKKEFRIDYNVMPPMLTNMDADTKDYVEKNFVKSPLINYRSGSDLSLPSGLRYSFERNAQPAFRQKLNLTENNWIERFVSFFVTDGINNYHSVIRVIPAEKTKVSDNASLPFVIRNWNSITFTDKKFIYQIDDEMWNSDYTEKMIDRSVSHTLHWQSVDFTENNKVNEFVIPSMPTVTARSAGSGTVVFALSDEDGYTFENGEKTVVAQAFYGEEIEGVYEAKIFLGGVFQGCLGVEYEMDRLPPKEPEFVASGNSSFSRNTLALRIITAENADVFYAVSEPVYYGEDSSADIEIKMPEEFSRYSGDDIVIKSLEDESCAYKVFAYSVDNAGNMSKIIEQLYVIDELNFYLASGEYTGNEDGSYMNPFVSFLQVVDALNSSESGIKLHLNGDVVVEGGEYLITKDCHIHGNGGKIILKGNASLIIDGASVSIDRCTVEKQSEDSSSPIAKICNGKFFLNDCEVAGFYGEDGKLFDIKDSEVSFKDCGFTIQAPRISMCSEIYGGTISVFGCRFTAIGQTASAMKIRNSQCVLELNLFTLIGGICKGIEITGGTVSFMGDRFDAQSDGKYKNSGAITRNGGCKVTGLSSTSSKGF